MSVGFVSVQSMIGRKATLSGSFQLSLPWLGPQLVKHALWPRAERSRPSPCGGHTRAVATGGALLEPWPRPLYTLKLVHFVRRKHEFVFIV